MAQSDTHNNEAGWVAGLDGGGTKTDLLCLNAQGKEIAAHAFGPLNVNSGSAESIADTLTAVVQYLNSLPGGANACAGLCVATAGLSNPQAEPLLHAALERAGFARPVIFRGDQEAALMGAVGNVGAVLVAGTGSICFGKNAQAETARTGGFGHLVDDEGSGYAIGRDMIAALLRAHDGRGPQTVLSTWVLEALDLPDIGALIRFVYQPQRDKKEIAALSRLLTPGIEAGDKACIAIAERAIAELFLLCQPVIDKLGLQHSVLAFSGGVLKNHAAVADGLRARLLAAYPHLSVMPAKRSAAFGAALMAKEQFLDA